MIEIIQDFIHINPFSRDGSKLKGKRGIVMHYTASPGAPARNIRSYFDNLKGQKLNDPIPDRYAGAHFSVDQISIIQSIPTDERGYHCGSSMAYTPAAITLLGGYPNDTTIGIEMCVELDGSIHEETFQNATDLVVYLIKVEKFPDVIFTHKQVVGWKNCPLPWVNNPSEFERFKQTVEKKLKEYDVVIKIEDANAIIKTISTAYLAASDPVVKSELHRQANIVRIASGQTTT